MDRRSQVRHCLVVFTLSNEKHSAKVVMRALIATIETVASPVLHGVGKSAHLRSVAGGNHCHTYESSVPCAEPFRMAARNCRFIGLSAVTAG